VFPGCNNHGSMTPCTHVTVQCYHAPKRSTDSLPVRTPSVPVFFGLLYGPLFISCERECASTDPLAADPWTPGVLAHLPTSRTVHTVQKKWWSSLKNVANPHFPLCRRPPPSAGSARGRTHATSRPAMRLRDRSHAPTNRTRGPPDHIRRQSVTGRRFTGPNGHIFPPSREPVGAVDGLRSRARSTRSADGCGPLRPSPGPPPGPYGRCDWLRARQA